MQVQSSRYTKAERDEILRVSREHIAKRGDAIPASEPEPLRCNEPNLVFKTVDNARVPEPEPQPVAEVLPKAQPGSAWDLWWRDLDQRVASMIDTAIRDFEDHYNETVGMALGETMRGMDKKFTELERQIAITRDESKIMSGLSGLRQEVERACKRQPRYEEQLCNLRDELAATKTELAKTRKTLSKERVTLSVLKHQVTAMEKDQRRDRQAAATFTRTVSETLSVDLENVGADTRKAMAQQRQHHADSNTPWLIEIVGPEPSGTVQ